MSVLVRAIGSDWPARVLFDARQVRIDVARLAEKPGAVFYPRSIVCHVSPAGQGMDMHMYGVDLAGQTVAIRATGFVPYLFLRVGDATPQRIEWFMAHLNDLLIILALQYPNGRLGHDVRKTLQKRQFQAILHWKLVDAVPLKCTGADRGYHGGKTDVFLQVFCYAPSIVAVIPHVLEYIGTHWADGTGDFTDAVVALHCDLTKRRKQDNADGERQPEKKAKLDESASQSRTFAGMDDAEEEPNPWHDVDVDVHFDEPAAAEDAESPFDRTHWRVKQLLDACTERGGHLPFFSLRGDTVPECYEADLDIIIRFCIDSGYGPEEAVQFTGADHACKPFMLDDAMEPTTGGNYTAFSADWQLFRRAPADMQDIVPPQICVSFDCEMETGPNDAFPVPSHQRVLQICCVIFDPVADAACKHVVRRAFILGDSVELPANEGWHPDEVYVCPDEFTLLKAWARWTTRLQPDMLTGWNIGTGALRSPEPPGFEEPRFSPLLPFIVCFACFKTPNPFAPSLPGLGAKPPAPGGLGERSAPRKL